MLQIIYRLKLGIIALLLTAVAAQAQLSVGGQLRVRSELRNGQGTLVTSEDDPAFFTSQRSRLTFGYKAHRLQFKIAIQDVRVWGQDASSIHAGPVDPKDGLMMHQANARILLTDTSSKLGEWSLKIGRQELLYDDSRLLGNLDWLQQGRRHDAALLQFNEGRWRGDLGVAYNQNSASASGTVYDGVPSGYPAGSNGIGVMYKSLQFAYLRFALKNQGFISLLSVKDDFNKYELDSAGTRIWGKGVWSRYTSGINMHIPIKRVSIKAFAFDQRGQNRNGATLSAWTAGFETGWKSLKNFGVKAGAEILSGNNGGSNSGVDMRFDPLYGTPHKFWGYMDYFYVASPFGTAGLANYYLKFSYSKGKQWSISCDVHEFQSANNIADGNGGLHENRYGTEIDLIGKYQITEIISIQGGYSTLFATETLASEQVKNVDNPNLQAHWAFLMINVKPDFGAFKYVINR